MEKQRQPGYRSWQPHTLTHEKNAEACAHGNDILYSDTDKRITTHIDEDIMYMLVRERMIFRKWIDGSGLQSTGFIYRFQFRCNSGKIADVKKRIAPPHTDCYFVFVFLTLVMTL